MAPSARNHDVEGAPLARSAWAPYSVAPQLMVRSLTRPTLEAMMAANDGARSVSSSTSTVRRERAATRTLTVFVVPSSPSRRTTAVAGVVLRVDDGEARLEERVVRALGQELAERPAWMRAGGQLLLVGHAVAVGIARRPVGAGVAGVVETHGHFPAIVEAVAVAIEP